MTRGSQRVPVRTLASVFAWPALIAAATFAGLVLGLTGVGWQDSAAWALLSLPFLAVLACWAVRG